MVDFAENSYGIRKRLLVVEEWLELLQRRNGQSTLKILDYGCGTGDHLTAPLARLGHLVTGLDVHEPSIREARKRHCFANLTFLSSPDTLFSSTCVYDVIICSEVLEHVPDPVGFLSALRRLLDAQGALIVTTPNGYGSYEILSSLQRRVHGSRISQFASAAMRKIFVEPNETKGFLNQDSGHIQFFRVKALEFIFRQSGFGVATRRSRTLLCGPYIDLVFELAPLRRTLVKWNAGLADRLPFSWAADWMFLLEPLNSNGRSQ